MYSVIGDLIGYIGAPVTKYATGHMQLDLIADLMRLECPSLFLVSGIGHPVLVGKILKVTFSRLITYRAIEGMVQ
jgi:hypothetical protein